MPGPDRHRLVWSVLLTAAALVVGGLIVVLLVSGPASDASGPAVGSGVPTAALGPPGNPELPARGRATPEAAAAAIAQAIEDREPAEFAALTCRAQTPAELGRLGTAWDAAGPVTATPTGTPVRTGSTATVVVRVQAHQRSKDTTFPLALADGNWCIPG